MNEMELLDATSVAGLPKGRFDEMERHNSRSYRSALHMRAMLSRHQINRANLRRATTIISHLHEIITTFVLFESCTLVYSADHVLW
jgi:hypothetical protein